MGDIGFTIKYKLVQKRKNIVKGILQLHKQVLVWIVYFGSVKTMKLCVFVAVNKIHFCNPSVAGSAA